MGINLGILPPLNIYLGNTLVDKIYFNNIEVWQSGPLLWTPANISTLIWVDANDTTTFTRSGNNISEWRDKSGNNIHLSNLSLATQPLYTSNTLNGKAVVDFTSANRFLLTTTSFSNITNGSYYIVTFIPTNTGLNTGQAPLSFNGSSTRNAGIVFQQNFGVDPFLVPKPLFTTKWATYALVQPAAVANKIATYTGSTFNGTFQFDTTTTSNSSPFGLGYRQVGSLFMNCLIAEVVICNQSHDVPTRQKMEGYLAWKWGMEADLPIDHPYKDSPPTT
jgi:hypothetical protein